jgi:hypothetical protein
MDEPTDEWMTQIAKRMDRHIDDGGFTAGVLSRLPRRQPAGLRTVVLVAASGLATSLALLLLGPNAVARGVAVLALYHPLVDPIPLLGVAVLAVVLLGGFTVVSEE